MSFPDSLQLCRLCLFEKNSYVDIFEQNERHGFRIVDVINEMLELDVTHGDGLPERVCQDCLSEMARFKRFKKLCQEAKLTLNYIIALAAGTVPPPTSLPSFLTSTQNSVVEPNKSTVASNAAAISTDAVICPSKLNSVANTTDRITSTSVEPVSSRGTVTASVQVNLEDVLNSSTNHLPATEIVKPQLRKIQQDSGNQGKNPDLQNATFGAVQKGSDTDDLGEDPLSVEAVLSEPDNKMDCKEPAIVTVAKMYENVKQEAYTGEICISAATDLSSAADLFSSCVAPGPRTENCKSVKSKEPEVVDLVDDEDEGSDMEKKSTYHLPKTSLPSEDSGNGRLDSDGSAHFKNSNDDSDMENMCEDPLPVETVLLEPDTEMDGEMVKCGSVPNAVESRDESLGLFSLTSTLNDLVASSEGEGNESLIRTSNTAIENVEHLIQNNVSDAFRRQIGNPNNYPFWCPICGKHFMRKDKLKQHSVVHSNERPFICRICGCSYKRKDKLTSHVTSSHLQHLPHECDICGKRFVRKDKLKQHSVVHSNRRPYACKECGKKYKLKAELKKHEKRVHSQGPHP